jgi:hypothetical protein
MGGTTLYFTGKMNKVFQRLTSEVLDKHRILRVPDRRRIPLSVYLLNISHNGFVAEYKVRLGEFRVYIKVLNLSVGMSYIKNPKAISEGMFGDIMMKNRVSKEFVAKLQRRAVEHKTITDLINDVII